MVQMLHIECIHHYMYLKIRNRPSTFVFVESRSDSSNIHATHCFTFYQSSIVSTHVGLHLSSSHCRDLSQIRAPQHPDLGHEGQQGPQEAGHGHAGAPVEAGEHCVGVVECQEEESRSVSAVCDL